MNKIYNIENSMVFIDSKYGYTNMSGSLILNFSENNKHGCKNNCQFCFWKKYTRYVCPSNDEIKTFLKYCHAENISISGGGEPLYNFSKNKDELTRICDFLHENKKTVELITADYSTLLENLDYLTTIFDKMTFSIQTVNNENLELLKKVSEKIGVKNVRIIKLYDYDSKASDISVIKEYIDFYKPYVGVICIRENYLNRMDNDTFNAREKEINSISPISMLSRTALQIVLIGNTIMDIIELDNYLSNMSQGIPSELDQYIL